MDAMPPPADAETPAEVPRSVMLDASGERFVATLLKDLEAVTEADAGLEGALLWAVMTATLPAYYRLDDLDVDPQDVDAHLVGRDVGEATARVAHLCCSDAVWARALAVLHTPYRADDEEWLDRTKAVVQLLCSMYGFVDPMDCADCDAAGPWVHAVEVGVSEATAKAAIEGLQRHVGDASRAIGAVMLVAARDQASRDGGGHPAGGRGGGRRGMAVNMDDAYSRAWIQILHTALRCVRHMASLETSVHYEHLDSTAMLDAFTATFRGDRLTGMSLSALWALLDASRECCDMLAANYGELMDTLQSHLSSSIAEPVEEEGYNSPGLAEPPLTKELVDEMDDRILEVAIGTLWGCSSRVSPLCAVALMRHGLHTAAANLVTCRLTPSVRRPSLAARVCAAGALAGWVAAAAMPVQPEHAAPVAAALAEMDALWADPDISNAISAFMGRALAVLDADMDGGGTGGGSAPVEEVHPLTRWGKHASSAAARETESLTLTDVVQTATYDWKARDLSDTVLLLCRLVARASAMAGTDSPLAEPPAHVLLPAAVAALPLCIMLQPEVGLLTPRRATHLCRRRATLVPALMALAASSSCPIAAAVGSATLSRLARACSQSAQSILAAQRRLHHTHMAALRGSAAGGDVAAPAAVALQLQPSGALVHASGHLLASHSPFFSALFSAAAHGFAPCDVSPGPSSSPGGTSSVAITLHDVEPAAFRALLHYCATGGCAFCNIADALAMGALANRLLMPDLVAITTACIRDRLAHLRGGLDDPPVDGAAPTKRHMQPPPEWMPIPLAPLGVVASECLHVLANADTDVAGHSSLAACALDTLAHSISVRGADAVGYLREHVLASASELPLGTAAAVQALVDEYTAHQAVTKALKSRQEGEEGQEEEGAAGEGLRRCCKRKRTDVEQE